MPPQSVSLSTTNFLLEKIVIGLEHIVTNLENINRDIERLAVASEKEGKKGDPTP